MPMTRRLFMRSIDGLKARSLEDPAIPVFAGMTEGANYSL